MTPRRAGSRLAVAGPLAPRSRHGLAERERGCAGIRCGTSNLRDAQASLDARHADCLFAKSTRTEALRRRRRRNARSMASI